MRKTLFILMASLSVAVQAQQPRTGTVILTVREPMGPVGSALIRAGDSTATTDAAGRARLILPAGRQAVTIARIGYVPKRTVITVVADSTTSVSIDVDMEGMAMKMKEVA